MRSSKDLGILTGYTNTAGFLGAVIASADANRKSLGFFPKSVYSEFARRDELLIATTEIDGIPCYVGHLLFKRCYPRVRINQIFTGEEYRRAGFAQRLIRHLVDLLTQEGFISIYARVAEDLGDANRFWDREGFYVQRVEKGGASRNRRIIVRCHELASPQLFPVSGINSCNPLGLPTSPHDVIPLYLLDLNVLFDIAPRRLRHDSAASLIQAERMGYCRLAISSEVREELKRTARQGKTDPMEAYIAIFPSFPLFECKKSDALLEELAFIVFGPEAMASNLSVNDRSDLRHIATAIQNELAGLITSDGAILKAAQQLAINYKIEVVFALDDAAPRTEGVFETEVGSSSLALRAVSGEESPAIHRLLAKLKLSASRIASGWLIIEPARRIANAFAVWDEEEPISYATWPAKSQGYSITVRMAADEAHPLALPAIRILLLHILEQLACGNPSQVYLELAPHQPYVREVAASLGFRGTPDQAKLVKLALGCVLSSENWYVRREDLANKFGLKLPLEMPRYQSPDQLLQVFTPDGNRMHVTLDDLESLISPALICLPGRPAVITPVRRKFSERLLGHSRQLSLLPLSSASGFSTRRYLSGPATFGKFKRGTLVFFYESLKSDGRGGIVAVARVRDVFLKPYLSLDELDLAPSVLSRDTIEQIGSSPLKTVMEFDNTFPLNRPVPLARLREIGCGDPVDLISTRKIDDMQVGHILRGALDHA